MTLFEKIYFTIGIISVIMFCIYILSNEELDELWTYPFCLQFTLTIIYEIIRLLLWIWGINIDLFQHVTLMGGR